MSSVQAGTSAGASSLRRGFALGFVAGVVVTVPLVFLAMLTDVGEALLAVFVPGTVVLSPLTDVMAGWPGLVNVGLGAIANGLVYGALAVAFLAGRRAVTR